MLTLYSICHNLELHNGHFLKYDAINLTFVLLMIYAGYVRNICCSPAYFTIDQSTICTKYSKCFLWLTISQMTRETYRILPIKLICFLLSGQLYLSQISHMMTNTAWYLLITCTVVAALTITEATRHLKVSGHLATNPRLPCI